MNTLSTLAAELRAEAAALFAQMSEKDDNGVQHRWADWYRGEMRAQANAKINAADRLDALAREGWRLTFADERDFLLAASPIIGAVYADSAAAAERINRCPGGFRQYGEIRADLPPPPTGDA